MWGDSEVGTIEELPWPYELIKEVSDSTLSRFYPLYELGYISSIYK
jgi:hypothetical protein